MQKATKPILFTTVATVFCISVSSADQVFRVVPRAPEVTMASTLTGQETNVPIETQSINYNPYINVKKETNDMILNDLYLEKQEHAHNLSQLSFDLAENYIKSLEKPFLKSPDAFVRPSGHIAFYWGLGKERHIILSVIDDDLLLSVVFPEEDMRIIKPSSVENFNELAQTINDYLG